MFFLLNPLAEVMKNIFLPISTAGSLHLYLQSKRAADAWKVGKKVADKKRSSSFPSRHCLMLFFSFKVWYFGRDTLEIRTRLHVVFVGFQVLFVGFFFGHSKFWKISEGSLLCEVGKGEFHLLKGEISAH